MKILHFADLHLGVETYGHINSATGLSTRLEDCLKALDSVVEYAIENKIDLVLFCGDAYKSREPSPTQQREFARRIKRLSDNNVPVFLLVGNHDLPNAIGRATATEIFDTLSVDNVSVANKPGTCTIDTSGGKLQVVALPWLRRSTLLSREDTSNMNIAQINERLQQILTSVIHEQAQKLNTDLPAILAAHVWVIGAKIGSEKSMSIGQEHMLILSNISHPSFDYVALGHIHKHQVLQEQPAVVYTGSLERLDFGDEGDEKGFYVVNIETDKCPRIVTIEFHKLDGRKFVTLNVSINSDDVDPTTSVLYAIREKQNEIKDSIVRLNVELSDEAAGRLRDNEIRSALKEAHYVTIAKNVARTPRTRLGAITAEEITPGQALRSYLDSKYPPDRARILLEYGERLIQEHKG